MSKNDIESNLSAEIHMPAGAYDRLVQAIIFAASKLTDLPDLINVDDIRIALGDVGNIWPSSITECAA